MSISISLGTAVTGGWFGADPSTLGNAILILDAAIGFTPSSWGAVVGNAGTQGTGAKQPSLVTNALNGQPGVLFAAGQQMSLTNPLAAPGTILSVAKTTGDATNYRCLINTSGLFLYANGPESKLGMYMNADANSGATDSTFSIISAQVTSPSSIAYRVNRVPSTSTAGVSYYSSIGFESIGGASAGQDLLGTICYIAVYSTVLTATQIASWEGYANRRWGL